MCKKILVIDDDQAIRKSFSLALEDTDFIVVTASSGKKGIEMLAHDNYQVIFLDLKMPGLNGAETLRKIREFNTDVPVYIITAFHDEFFFELKKLQQDGIYFELLRKPLGSEMIALVTQRILGGEVAL
jgi:CheY-like chemotaxis protein